MVRVLPTRVSLVLAATCLITTQASAVTVFSDNFNRATSETVGNGWNEFDVIDGNSVLSPRVLFSRLNFGRNDNGGNGQAGSTVQGATYVTRDISGEPNQLSQLASYTETVEWTFNVGTTRSATLGGVTGGYGWLVALGATSSDPFSSGSGYMVLNTNNNVRLVSFNSGFDDATLTTILQQNIGGGEAIGANNDALSVRVLYDPGTDTWELFTRVDDPAFSGAPAFADPLNLAGYTSAGTAANSDFTATNLDFVGALWRKSGQGDQLWVDNFNIQTILPQQEPPAPVVPEPMTAGLALLGGAALILRRRQA